MSCMRNTYRNHRGLVDENEVSKRVRLLSWESRAGQFDSSTVLYVQTTPCLPNSPKTMKCHILMLSLFNHVKLSGWNSCVHVCVCVCVCDYVVFVHIYMQRTYTNTLCSFAYTSFAHHNLIKTILTLMGEINATELRLP